MRIVAFRIPSQVVLPGLVVQIRRATGRHHMLDGDSGAWEYNERGLARIWINSSRPLRRQRMTLLHELQHVLTDYMDQAMENHPGIFALRRDLKKRKIKARHLVRGKQKS